MSTLSKALAAAAGNAGGDAPNVEDVFSTYLYTGNFPNTGGGETQTITNGIDLDGEGGMVWMKGRSNIASGYVTRHYLTDTERGVNKVLMSNEPTGETTERAVSSFNSDGFTAGDYAITNITDGNFVSWTFRKAPRFFDVVTWTGSGAQRTIPHNLGVVPGMIIVKRTDAQANWAVYHRSISNSEYLMLDQSNNALPGSHWNSTSATDSVFHLGTDGDVNRGGVNAQYIAYIFAHDPVGEDDDGMIACGSYTGNSGVQSINLGWEPQYVLIKQSTGTGGWAIYDSMRTMVVSDDSQGNEGHPLYAHLPNSEDTTFSIKPQATGFAPPNAGSSLLNANGETYIYMAIRAPMMVEPEAGTEVFATDSLGSTGDGKTPGMRAPFPVDMTFNADLNASGGKYWSNRLTGTGYLDSRTTASEGLNPPYTFDYNNGWWNNTNTYAPQYSWMFKRAKGVFDIVAYDGNGVNGRSVNHSLSVVPEMMIVKQRDTIPSGSYLRSWNVYHKSLASNETLLLEEVDAVSTIYQSFYNTTPTDSVFYLSNSSQVNASSYSRTYIAYLFATLDGVSKVGSYTGTGAALTIDCGFSTGARFVLIKCSSNTGQWQVFDSDRGITATDTDPVLYLNHTNPQQIENPDMGLTDVIQPDSSGFKLTSNGDVNTISREYIFLAIA